MKLTDLQNPTYIALETFKKSGEGVNTPVWVIEQNDKFRVWTPADSWKVKRIRNNSHVRVATSDSQGKPTGEWLDARATVIDDPAEEQNMRKMLAKKYGLFYRMIAIYYALFKRGKSAVVLELSNA